MKVGASLRSGVKKRTKRLRQRVSMHIYVLPNLFTTGNMFFGFFSIIHSIKGEFLYAAYAIVVAAVFDLLDGRLARLTRSTSKFGAEYDSICDMVSFGVAPSVLLYLWALQPFERVGWLASFLYAACAGLRLARFNVQAEIIEKNYFQGLPTPMAAGIVASSVLAFTELELESSKSPLLLGITLLLALVMVSNFRYRSFKDLDLKQRLPFWVLVLGVVLFIVIAYWPPVTLFIMFLSYAMLGAIFGIFKIGKPYRKSPIVEATEFSAEDDLHEEVDEHEEDEK